MRNLGIGVNLPPMSADQRIVLRLEVDLEADPVTGTLTQSGQPARPFTGWLAFTEALEAIRIADGEQRDAEKLAD